MIDVVPASSTAQLDEIRTLIREFSDWVLKTFHANDADVPPAFRKLDEELGNLPGKYAGPDGTMLLAKSGDRPVGCLLGFRHDARSMEVSRLWVRPEGRGHGIGAALVKRAKDHARTAGYERVVLRSHRQMHAAHDVYRAAGFVEVDGPGVFPEIRKVALAMECSLG